MRRGAVEQQFRHMCINCKFYQLSYHACSAIKLAKIGYILLKII